MKSLLSLVTVLFAVLGSVPALAVPVLKLDCRIDNSASSFPRTIELRDGMIETIDCQTHPTCKNSIYEITMNYNSTYEYVIVAVTDTEIKKTFSTQHTLAPNTTGNSLNDAMLLVGYGDVVTSMNDLPDLFDKGRFLSINCDRVN